MRRREDRRDMEDEATVNGFCPVFDANSLARHSLPFSCGKSHAVLLRLMLTSTARPLTCPPPFPGSLQAPI